MTLASATRLLAVLLAPCLVVPAWGRPAVVQGGEQSAPNKPAPPGGEVSTPDTPAPPHIANSAQSCPNCAKGAQGCASCGSRLASLLHRQTCIPVHQKKICAPCGLQHYGYYPACWHPWPFPTYYGHCPPPVPPAAAQPPWYDPGNPHPPKGDEALPEPTPVSPDLKEEPSKPNGEKKKDEDAKKKDEDTKKKDEDTKKKDNTDKPKSGQPQAGSLPPLKGTLLPPLTNYNLSTTKR